MDRKPSGAVPVPQPVPPRLYRGVNRAKFEGDGGRRPRNGGAPFSSMPRCGESHAVCGSGIVCGLGATNSVVAHQWKQTGAFPQGTSGVSTSPHFERAKFYALANGEHREGRIVEFDSLELQRLGVLIYPVRRFAPAPAVPHDDEHILVAADLRDIPMAAVVRIHTV